MKNIIYSLIILSFIGLGFTACTDTEGSSFETGYLRLDVSANQSVNTKADVYDAKVLAVEIVNSAGITVKSYSDWNNEKETSIELSAGSYTIKASSYGFDGKESGWDKPYYAGITDVVVKKDVSTQASLVCTLANVKVSVEYDETFKSYFTNATMQIRDQDEKYNSLSFLLANASENKSAYFPVTPLKWNFSATNNKGVTNSTSGEIETVEAQDHFKFIFQIAEPGQGNITVSIDSAMNELIYTFIVPQEPSKGVELTMNATNAWSKFAYVSGKASSKDVAIVPENVIFKYKKSTDGDWQEVSSVVSNDNYAATLKELIVGTSYQLFMMYSGFNDNNEIIEYSSDTTTFITESALQMPNSNLDAWHSTTSWGRTTWHPYGSNDTPFWGSGNKGANTLSTVNPTAPEETLVHTANGKAAKLASKTAAGQFAAGSLYSGEFLSATLSPLGAKLDFGREFANNRPTTMKGWFMYNPGSITHTNKDFIVKGDRDSCSIYIALTNWSEPFEVSTGDSKFVDLSDPSIIAYGELDKSLCSPEKMDSYVEFTIPIKYRNLVAKPTYVLVVCSSSRYGDYFTGSTSSVMYLDDFELLYDDEPVVE